MKKRIKINGIIIAVCVILIFLYPFKFLRIGVSFFDDWLRIAGMFFVLFGILLRVSSRGFKSENSGGGNALVKSGPYSLVRNPMYLGIFLIGLGAVMLIFRWWVLFVFFAFILTRYITLVIKEEKLLLNNFGQEYSQYCKDTPRLFPRVTVIFSGKADKILPLKLAWIKKELNSIIPLFLCIFAVELWQRIKFGDPASLYFQFIWYSSIIISFVIFAIFLSRSHENISK